MVAKNLTLPYQFVCFTENTQGINRDTRCEPLPQLPLEGWWYKLWFLSKEFPLNGNILFLDLDLIVFRNIDDFFSYNPRTFCIIRDFNRSVSAIWNRYNSSVFRFESHRYHNIYDRFIKNPSSNVQRYRGDQEYLYQHLKPVTFWPDEWIQSYKWEMRDRKDIVKIDGKRLFKNQAAPKIKKNTRVAVFHGEPNIHDCQDEWVVKHWG